MLEVWNKRAAFIQKRVSTNSQDELFRGLLMAPLLAWAVENLLVVGNRYY
jgi:hypothetical protein